MSADPTPLVAVVVAFDSEELLPRCLTALLEAGVESVLVWDNSPAPRKPWCQATLGDPRVRRLGDGVNHGFGGGINRAVDTLGDLAGVNLLFVNPDCFVNEAAVSRIRDRLADPSVGAVAPGMRYPDGRRGIAGGSRPSVIKEALAATRVDDLMPRRVRSYVLSGAGGRLPWGAYGASVTSADDVALAWVSGFCMGIRGTVFQQAGGFDESFFLYFEDVDLCRRVAACGLKLLVLGGVEVEHVESTSTERAGKSRLYWAGFEQYAIKYRLRAGRRLASLMQR
ncbi:glycosyltransferase family 2 protein [Nocardioides daeguensis]|uniref:Glycosyltransferase family 2 protein n=1 Tax=Nocardioides daeguensis TaxID=908359 RepID=A0ABP6V9Z6_9ACTN|nr:glycosyltransferase family 2 protein [Nocardioides daeguensis]MBV6726178.1 glycosyltransferase family 2 protein [Nocardioides daeguensis]MCR1772021.1 glycosyltransferase family 2 protein [Nocardioides daeguensis]